MEANYQETFRRALSHIRKDSHLIIEDNICNDIFRADIKMNLCLNAAHTITDKGEIRVKLSETFLDTNIVTSKSGEEIPKG